MEGVEPTTPRLQITCSSQLSYIGSFFAPLVGLFPKGIAKIDINFLSPKFSALFFDFFHFLPLSHGLFPAKKGRIPAIIPPASPG